jgi:hypothetical protein
VKDFSSDNSLRCHHHHTHQLHRKEMLRENQKNSTGVLPEGFLLVFIKVNSYLGALLFKQVAESFFKSKGEVG